MNKVLSKPSWQSLCSLFWRSQPPSAINNGRGVTKKSYSTETKPSSRFGANYFLRLACLALLVAGFLWQSDNGNEDSRVPELLQRNWLWLDSNPCPGAVGFVELSGEGQSIELLLTQEGRVLASGENLPEPPRACTPIPEPNFVQEI